MLDPPGMQQMSASLQLKGLWEPEMGGVIVVSMVKIIVISMPLMIIRIISIIIIAIAIISGAINKKATVAASMFSREPPSTSQLHT